MAKLKTFTTKSGFYELAVAAPSMKAALEAWGMEHNAFAHGEAAATTDKAILEAAEATPGIVLKRPVGSRGAFREEPDAVPLPPKPKTRAKKAKKNIVGLRKAEAALAMAQTAHEAKLGRIAEARAQLDEEEEKETARWHDAQGKLKAAIGKAKR